MGTTVREAPRPKSPPSYPDFCGRHRLQVEVQSLNREIGFLEEELHSLEDTHPASRCCKEVNDFVGTNPDPLIPLDRKAHKSCRVWRWIRENICFNFSWLCCSSKCSFKFRKPSCSCHPFKKCCCNCNLRCCQCRCFHCCCQDLFKPCQCPCPRCCCSDCCFWNIFTFSCARPSCCSSRCCRRCSCAECFTCPRCPRCSCPKCSCGCVFSCPDCTEACLCLSPKCSKPCCVSRCLCP